MTVPDRRGLARGLRAALAAPKPAQRLSAVLRDVLASTPVPWESEEQRLMRHVSERVDVVAGPARLVPVARDVQALLEDASSNTAVALLLELMAERERLIGIFRKYSQGAISRTSFLSFVAEQRWPEGVRRRVAALAPDQTAAVVRALEQRDIPRLETLLVA